MMKSHRTETAALLNQKTRETLLPRPTKRSRCDSKELKTIDPSSHILGEEDAERSPTARSFKRQWVIDPIDGTINFARDIDIYTSTASLIDNGKPTIAVVYQPWPRTITIAVRGHGCWRWDGVIGAECNLSGIKLTTQTTRWSKSLHALMLTPKISENSHCHTPANRNAAQPNIGYPCFR